MTSKTIAAIAMIGAIALLVGLVAVQQSSVVSAAKLDKVTICHEGNVTITVSGNAVEKHIENHNDTLGACA